jgi:hypothetical protein
MRLAMTGVNHQPLEVRGIDELFHQGFPDATVTPSAETSMGILPTTVCGRQIAPRRSGSQNPQNRIDEASVVLAYTAPLA